MAYVIPPHSVACFEIARRAYHAAGIGTEAEREAFGLMNKALQTRDPWVGAAGERAEYWAAMSARYAAKQAESLALARQRRGAARSSWLEIAQGEGELKRLAARNALECLGEIAAP